MMKMKNEELWALGSYCLSSILITLLNKAVLSSSNFRMNFLLLAVQAGMSVFLLFTFRRGQLISFKDLKREESVKWLPVSLLLIGMIYTGSKTLQHLTVAMFTVFKNLTIIVVALGEERVFGSRITSLMWISFALMVTGSIIGGFNDLAFSSWGYFWMLLNSASSATYLLYMKWTIKKVGFADYDSVYYNNILSLPVLVILSLVFEDWSAFRTRVVNDTLKSNLFLLTGMMTSGLAGFFISYTTAWSIRVSASTNYSMVGALNKLPVAVSGLIFFAKEREAVNLGYILSIIVAFTSGIVYSISQVLKKKEESNKSAEIEKLNESVMTEFYDNDNLKTSRKMDSFELMTGLRPNSYELLPMPMSTTTIK